MTAWHRNMPYRAIDPGHDPADDEDHSGENEQEEEQYDDENPDAE